jgi:endonuclease/exonuclease/phosphatase family metal-dependent hydrolase
MGVFFVQALRFLVGNLYSQLGSAAAAAPFDPASLANIPGVVAPSVVSSEISFLVYVIALPLLALILGRRRWLLVAAVVIAAVGRALMVATGVGISSTMAAEIVLGGGLLYIATLIRQRGTLLPYFFIFGLAVDQVYRAVGNTLDPSWSPDYFNTQIILSIIVVLIALLALLGQRTRSDEPAVSPDYGLLTLWGGLGLGALLFVELSLLALPNAVAGRAFIDYTNFVPLILTATLLPIIPWVRKRARGFIALFDPGVRGWSWMLLVALLVVFGTRFQGLPAGIALVIAQFAASLMWWWLVRPQAEKERNFTGLGVVVTVLIFGLLVVCDNFTYEYAYVGNFAPPMTFLNNLIPPLLRGFRGMGLAVLLLSIFLAAIPMVRTQKRIPWTGGTSLQSALGLLVVLGFAIGGAAAARPPVIVGVRGVDSLRIGTYNIHSGYSGFYNYDLEDIAQTIQVSGANVVLVQQTEAGRLTSFGVDQPLWLARRLGMDRRFFPTNEGLQGLAVLSNVEIVYDDGALLTSIGNQTGLQRVQVRPDAGVITVYNTWLGLPVEAPTGEPLNVQDQQRQLAEIFAIVATQHNLPNFTPDCSRMGRTVIGGTFNNVPDSPLIDQMRQIRFSDPLAGLPIELSATFDRLGFPRARLDYLWLCNLPAEQQGVMKTSASDHHMAVAEVAVTRQQ